MGPEYFWMHGMWAFPVVMPIMMLIIMLVVVFLIFSRGGFRPPWQNQDRPNSESPMDILKKRYAKGEITKEEFEQMKKDILS
jgi:putative membrane protein